MKLYLIFLLSIQFCFASDFSKSLERLEKAQKSTISTFSMRGVDYQIDTTVKRAERTPERKQKATFLMVIALLGAALFMLISNRFTPKTKLIGEMPDFDIEDKIYANAMRDYFKKDDDKKSQIEDKRKPGKRPPERRL